MRRFRILLSLSRVATFLACSVTATPGNPNHLVITHVAIVDTHDGNLLTDRDVVIVGGRILSVAPAAFIAAEPNTAQLDGRGKYLIPGLWDCHIHLSWNKHTGHPFAKRQKKKGTSRNINSESSDAERRTYTGAS